MRGFFRTFTLLVVALLAALTLASGVAAQDEDDFPIGEPVSEAPDPNLPIDESPDGEASGAENEVTGTEVEVTVHAADATVAEANPTGAVAADPDANQPVDESPLVDENGEYIEQAPGDPNDFPIGEPAFEAPDPNLPIDESPDGEASGDGPGAPTAASAPLSASV